jgi:acetyltransferase-like isoleucine patch superfamily enzyme
MIRDKLKALYQNLGDRSPLLARIVFRARHGNLIRTVKRRISGTNHRLLIHPDAVLRNVVFIVKGEGHHIEIASRCVLRNVMFYAIGSSHTILLGPGVRFKRGGQLWLENTGGRIDIGENTTFEESHLAVTGDDTSIRIGSDCMFAYDIDVRTGDSHALLDANGRKINPEKSVHIGDHVWIASHCSILKGVSLPAHTVVATRSTVTKSFTETNLLVGGSPAKIIKQGITWSRERFAGSSTTC